MAGAIAAEEVIVSGVEIAAERPMQESSAALDVQALLPGMERMSAVLVEIRSSTVGQD